MSNSLQPNDSSNSLQVKLQQLHQERDRALDEVSKWRRRYEVEAQQRRTESELADKTIRELRAEISQLCQIGASVRPLGHPKTFTAINVDQDTSRTSTMQEVDQLRQERDTLIEALSQEQQQHTQTRENLITALGEVLQRGKTK